MQPGSQPVVLCAGTVVADAIASPVDAAPPAGVLTLVDSGQLATGGCALSTRGMGASSTLRDADEALAL
jgi:hypothetical protein